ncbi:MAG: hypothetical protein R6V33_02550 [Pelovirga sp.]
MHQHRQQLWAQIVTEVVSQYQTLESAEKVWLQPMLHEIAALQQQLDRLFMTAAGEQHCARCAGDCCSAGHHHMTLVNLLQYISRQEQPPEPDFNLCCPFLADRGCVLPAARRPYNCISFICDIIESSLKAEQVTEFYRLEGRLRQLYLAVARRYQGAAMTGLLLQYGRLQGHSFFSVRDQIDAEG